MPTDTLTCAEHRLDNNPTTKANPGPKYCPLTKTIQILKTSYVNPITNPSTPRNADGTTPLPRHYWQFHKIRGFNKSNEPLDEPFVITSELSAADGTTRLGGRQRINDAIRDKNITPETRWELILVPNLTKDQLEGIRNREFKETWVDLEKNDWVMFHSFPHFDPQKRKLLRIPFWRSGWKAESGGLSVGRKNAPIGNQFLYDGTVSTTDLLTPYGTQDSPWEIQIDYNWLRTFMQLRYYDCVQKKHMPVPPGIGIMARGAKRRFFLSSEPSGCVGGGTAIDAEGTIYITHERSEADSVDIEFLYQNTSNRAVFIDQDPARTKSDMRLLRNPQGQRPTEPEKWYVLPDVWHSFGMEARIGTAARAKWEQLRPTSSDGLVARALTTTLDQPLIFHLDDTILWDDAAREENTTLKTPASVANAAVRLHHNARVTIFDHQMAFRGPIDPVTHHFWKQPLMENYLRAEEAIASDGDSWRQRAFVINCESDFFVLRDDRVDGTLGTTPCIGVRKAVAHAVANPIGNYLNGFPWLDGGGIGELHLLVDAYRKPYSAAVEGEFLAQHPDVSLCHLLVYVPVRVIADPTDPTVTQADVSKIYPELLNAAERWDQAHPAHGAAGKKDYVIVPLSGVAKGTRVVKVRHFFGVRTDGQYKMTIQARRMPTQILGARAFVSGRTLTIFSPEANPNDTSQDSDLAVMSQFTLAHELGHVMGLPDEYMESISIRGMINANPRIPRFRQAHEAYPFYADDISMMWWNQLPRLRYMWHHVAFLNGPAAWAFPSRPMVASHPTFNGGTTHIMPNRDKESPWKAIGQKRMSSNCASLVLYGAGDDESTVERMFKRPAGRSSPGAWIDGILVVVIKIWFNFLPSATGAFSGTKECWGIVRDFYTQILAPGYRAKQRFIVESPIDPKMRRIAVAFQPRIEFGPAPTADTSESDADIIVDVVFEKNQFPSTSETPIIIVSPQLTFLNMKPRLMVKSGSVNLSIIRFALGLKDLLPPNITHSELQELARVVESIIDAAPSSFTTNIL